MMLIESFKADLRILDSNRTFDKYVLTGSCVKLDDATSHQVRTSIAEKFQVEYTNVVIVGSANLGFSIKPSKRYQPFGDESDVDIAIVCNQLFEKVWREIYLYRKSKAVWSNRDRFMQYLIKGWIRPDLLPPSDLFAFSNEWWEYFNSLRVKGCDYKLAAGIYHSWFFLREYQTICIEQCKMELE